MRCAPSRRPKDAFARCLRRACNSAAEIGIPLGDPENPPCARLVFTGQFAKVAAGSTEEASAKKALFAKHPSFANYPPGHSFFVGKMELSGIWLIDFYGGASIISPADYFGQSKE